MFYTVYKVTNLINGKIYVGLHVTENLNDAYMGSGKQIQAAIKKYGRENFKKEYIKICESLEEMRDLEAEIVNEVFVKDTNTYNMKTGGIGGWDHYHGSEEHQRSARAGGKKAWKRLNDFIAEQKATNSEWWQNWHARICETNKKLSKLAQSPEAQAKRKSTYKKIKHQVGENNSQFGTCWITHSEFGNKKISKLELDKFLSLGYTKGRKIL